MTIPSFLFALCVPWLTRRIGNGRLLAVGIFIATIGMAWLGRLTGSSLYLADIALPMILIGIGQGVALAPLTAAGIAGTDATDAGAASGLVNVAHQIGSSLGLAVLVTVFAGATASEYSDTSLLAYRTGVSLTVAAVMLAVALLLVWALIVRPTNGPRRPAAA